jgi:hypothetical protein
MRVLLEDLLFNQRTQQEIILQLAEELEALSGTRPLDWLGNPLPYERPQRKRPIQQTCADVLGADRRNVFETMPDVDFGPIVAKLRAVAEGGSGLACTFVCLLALLVTDNLIDLVARSSPRPVCDAYFTARGGFEYRLTALLTGRMGYDSSSGKILQGAEPSFIVATREMLLLKSIISPTGA